MFYYKDESGKLGFFPVVASNFLLENVYNGDACILWCKSMFTVVLKAPQVTKKPNQVSYLSKIVSKTLVRRCKDVALQNMPDMCKQLCLVPSLNVSDSSAYVWRV